MESLRSNEASLITILHIVAPAEVGGVERVVKALVSGHSDAGHDVHVAAVVSSVDPDHAFLASLRGTGATAHVLAVSDRAYRHERALVRDLCHRIHPDVVHTHGYRSDVVDASVARRLGIPTVTTAHGFVGNTWRGRLYERVQRAAFRRFDHVVAVSQALGACITRDGVPTERLTILRNAWSGDQPSLDRSAARRELGVSRDGFRIAWVGRLTREKGADLMIDAFARLQATGLDSPAPSSPNGEAFALSIIGEGQERAALERRAAALGVADRITWHGLLHDAARVLPAFDVHVLSSRTEGTPIVLFEAMAAGVPIVATRVGGVPDVLSPAEGWLVPADDPDAIAAAVVAIRDNPSEIRARVRAARDRLEDQFSVEPWLARYEVLYRSVMRTATTPVAAL
ncbi:MAG: glycosyltransferase [Longimicrobiales bacterium]